MSPTAHPGERSSSLNSTTTRKSRHAPGGPLRRVMTLSQQSRLSGYASRSGPAVGAALVGRLRVVRRHLLKDAEPAIAGITRAVVEIFPAIPAGKVELRL